MANIDGKEIKKTIKIKSGASKNVSTAQNEAEVEAFNADLKLAEYRARIENGELTPEEKANRNRILGLLGFPAEE